MDLLSMPTNVLTLHPSAGTLQHIWMPFAKCVPEAKHGGIYFHLLIAFRTASPVHCMSQLVHPDLLLHYTSALDIESHTLIRQGASFQDTTL